MYKKGVKWLCGALLLLNFATNAGAALDRELVPLGEAVGISLTCRGVIVEELSEIETSDGGRASPARDAGLLPGDVVTSVAGRPVLSAEDLLTALEAHGGGPIAVGYLRDGTAREAMVTPVKDGDRFCFGFWVRESLSGIGTLTFLDPESGVYGALGHPVSDGETGMIVPVGEGSILPAKLTGITRGKSGTPGRLGGSLQKDAPLGDIQRNCQVGIFGEISGELPFEVGKAYPVAEEKDIKVGKATILSQVTGEVREYAVEIIRIYKESSDGRSMMVKVTDPELLELTGGIVQGMSGSPILQNGLLIGAVTHVLISDPAKGYAVSIEDMLAAWETDEAA